MRVPRLRVNRLVKQEGRLTKPVRARMWTALRVATGQHSDELPAKEDKPIQVIQNLPDVAIQVLRYMTEAVERRGAILAGRSADASSN
jgi:hypothetical protein